MRVTDHTPQPEQQTPSTALASRRFEPLKLDYERYRTMLGVPDDEQQRELLSQLWVIVVGFVDDEIQKSTLNNCIGKVDGERSAMLAFRSTTKTTTDAAERSRRWTAGELDS